jgi:hypothetical protein
MRSALPLNRTTTNKSRTAASNFPAGSSHFTTATGKLCGYYKRQMLKQPASWAFADVSKNEAELFQRSIA